MAGSPISAVGSPPSHEGHNLAQDWEILSASAVLAQGHGLGFGLPPLTTTPGLHTSRLDFNGDSAASFVSRGDDVPLDVSQIAVFSPASTSSVEPFTEGWKPHFRIAGAPLQENYYARDPFATASDTTGSLEPFLNMERNYKLERSRAADGRSTRLVRTHTKPEFLHVDYSERDVKHPVSPHQQESSKEDTSAMEEGIESCLEKPDTLDLSKCSIKNKYFQESVRIWRTGWGLFNRKSYFTWSIALTTVLLGVFIITYDSKKTENTNSVGELSTSNKLST